MENISEKDQFEYYLSSLDELGEILIEADKIESVASGILRLTLGTIMASNGAIFIFHKDDTSVSELCSIGINNNSKSIKLSDSFLVNIKVYQYGVLNYDKQPDWIEGDFKKYLAKSSIKTIIPLFHRNRLLGILCIGGKFMSEVFTNIDYKILEIISNHLTKSLFNYELIQNVEEKKQELNIKLLELETLFDIGVAISSVLDIDELAHDVLLRAVGILNASKGMFLLQNEKSPILDMLSRFNWGENKFLLSKNNILGSIATGVITINSIGEVDSINKAGENILKVEKQNILGNHYMYIFEHDNEIIELISKTEDNKKIYSEINIPFLTVSEDTIINISVAPRIDINNNTEGVVIAIEDISDINKVKNTFKRYVSKQVVDNLLDDETNLNLGGENREVTILFTDIRGFTSMAEKMKPEKVVLTLNEYFSEMIDIVFKHNGTLDKIIGDELMIVFGAPLSSDDDTERALNTAIEMQNNIEDLNIVRKKRKEPPILVGAGINKGQVVSGNIGSRDMMDYTVVGDTVNLGSRLCSAASAGEIIVSGRVKNSTEQLFSFKELKPIRVKGKKDKIDVYQVKY